MNKADKLLREANDILRSVNSIIERKGDQTNWAAIDNVIKQALSNQHKYLYQEIDYNTINDYVRGIERTYDVEVQSYKYDYENGSINIVAIPNKSLEYIQLKITISESGDTTFLG